MNVTFSCAPAAHAAGEKYNVEHYAFVKATEAQMRPYRQLVLATYGPLGFLNDHAGCFMPRDGTTCYVLIFQGNVIGSCSLTPVSDKGSVFHRLIPDQADSEPGGMVELNNIILIPELRGGVGLALILYHATLAAIEDGAGIVVGITRYQALRHFVEAGAIPVNHEPLHLLGRDDLHDFVIYYDVRSDDARTYLRERARRLFSQTSTLREIKSRVAPGPGALARQAHAVDRALAVTAA